MTCNNALALMDGASDLCRAPLGRSRELAKCPRRVSVGRPQALAADMTGIGVVITGVNVVRMNTWFR